MVSFHMMNVWLSVHLNIALILHHTHFGDLRRLCMVWFVLLSTGLNISVLASSLLAYKIAQIILVFFMVISFLIFLQSMWDYMLMISVSSVNLIKLKINSDPFSTPITQLLMKINLIGSWV